MPADRSTILKRRAEGVRALAISLALATSPWGAAPVLAQYQGADSGFAPVASVPLSESNAAPVVAAPVDGRPAAPVQGLPAQGQPASGLGAPTQALPPNLPPTDGTAQAPGTSVEAIALPEAEIFEPAQVVARVGRETILAGDLLGIVNQEIAKKEQEIPPEHLELFRKKYLPQYRRMMMGQLTQMSIEMKLLYFDFLRLVPPDRQIDLKNEVGASFMEKEAPRMMETFEVTTLEALDAKLRSSGSSLSKARQLYIETSLGRILLRQKIKDDPEISHQELLDRYESKKDSYFRPARVRYEELVVRKAKHPTPAAAFAELADMGNEVLGGAPLSAVAKRRSHGIGAAAGGQQDWINRDSLVTQQVEGVLFEIPVGKLSRIIEEADAFYIVRALERDGERFVPFDEVQDDLREEIKDELFDKARKDYLVNLYEKTHVWNKFESENIPSLVERERRIASEGIESMIPSLARESKPTPPPASPKSNGSPAPDGSGIPVPNRSTEFEMR